MLENEEINANSTNKSHKTIYLFILVIILILVTIGFNVFHYIKSNESSHYVESKKRDSYIIKNVDDTLLTNYLDKDKNLVIFWGTWCHYCVEETSIINDFIKNNPDAQVIIVSHDYTQEELKKYLDENNISWFIILDPEKKIRQDLHPDSTGIPSAYLLDKNKNILNYNRGDMTLDQLQAFYKGAR